jgi:hypothetical protein
MKRIRIKTIRIDSGGVSAPSNALTVNNGIYLTVNGGNYLIVNK